MISKEAFLYIMENISEQHKKDNALSEAISGCFDNILHINNNRNLEALLRLARLMRKEIA